ncbi:MAG: GNAT family N-acetyltransferase [Actinobacteria bacterium]|nr:GNAT family N-acetyltransferase [Actinomycetota bacterium]
MGSSEQSPRKGSPWPAWPDVATVAVHGFVTWRYSEPVALGPDHSLDTFECRSSEQTAWLRRHARQASSAGTAKVFVVTAVSSPDVVAYYGWAMADIGPPDVPKRLRRGAGRYDQPVALLARLGVDTRHEGKGLGAALLQDVMLRTLALGGEIGCRGLLVHCESQEARSFYQHLVPEFEQSPTDALHLVLLMKDIVRTLGTT